MSRVDRCRMVNIPSMMDSRGSLSFIEGGNHIPFDIKRIYYIYDVPDGFERGSHAHKNLHQLMIMLSGSVDIFLDDGVKNKSFHLSSPGSGLYICPMIWRDLKAFSRNAICLVLASDAYDESDYIRNYHDYIDMAGKSGG